VLVEDELWDDIVVKGKPTTLYVSISLTKRENIKREPTACRRIPRAIADDSFLLLVLSPPLASFDPDLESPAEVSRTLLIFPVIPLLLSLFLVWILKESFK
jgi:hypothetical protein